MHYWAHVKLNDAGNVALLIQ